MRIEKGPRSLCSIMIKLPFFGPMKTALNKIAYFVFSLSLASFAPCVSSSVFAQGFCSSSRSITVRKQPPEFDKKWWHFDLRSNIDWFSGDQIDNFANTMFSINHWNQIIFDDIEKKPSSVLDEIRKQMKQVLDSGCPKQVLLSINLHGAIDVKNETSRLQHTVQLSQVLETNYFNGEPKQSPEREIGDILDLFFGLDQMTLASRCPDTRIAILGEQCFGGAMMSAIRASYSQERYNKACVLTATNDLTPHISFADRNRNRLTGLFNPLAALSKLTVPISQDVAEGQLRGADDADGGISAALFFVYRLAAVRHFINFGQMMGILEDGNLDINSELLKYYSWRNSTGKIMASVNSLRLFFSSSFDNIKSQLGNVSIETSDEYEILKRLDQAVSPFPEMLTGEEGFIKGTRFTLNELPINLQTLKSDWLRVKQTIDGPSELLSEQIDQTRGFLFIARYDFSSATQMIKDLSLAMAILEASLVCSPSNPRNPNLTKLKDLCSPMAETDGPPIDYQKNLQGLMDSERTLENGQPLKTLTDTLLSQKVKDNSVFQDFNFYRSIFDQMTLIYTQKKIAQFDLSHESTNLLLNKDGSTSSQCIAHVDQLVDIAKTYYPKNRYVSGWSKPLQRILMNRQKRKNFYSDACKFIADSERKVFDNIISTDGLVGSSLNKKQYFVIRDGLIDNHGTSSSSNRYYHYLAQPEYGNPLGFAPKVQFGNEFTWSEALESEREYYVREMKDINESIVKEAAYIKFYLPTPGDDLLVRILNRAQALRTIYALRKLHDRSRSSSDPHPCNTFMLKD